MPLRILFALNDSTQSRHFIGALQQLVLRGHDVRLLVKGGGRHPKLPVYLRHIPELQISWVTMPKGVWGKYARAFRGTRNYLLYNHPRLANATVFRERAYEWTDPFLRRFLPTAAGKRQWFKWFLEGVERAIPPDPGILEMMANGNYDLVLVSPYIFYQNTFHNDYVKCAHVLGVPVGFPVFSWDNLSTKGNVHILPDRIWVWNETQRQELIDFHGVPAELVSVTGAYRFDEYRQFRPSCSRDEFCAKLGLDPRYPIISYLGSSPAVAPDEGQFAARWLAAVKGSDSPLARSANVVVRAHPRNVNAWKVRDDIVSHERVAFQEPVSSNFWDTQNLFDLLSYTDAAIGLNTSAMLEAAIHGVPVHTIKDPDTHRGQEGTVHFEYLTTAGGGLLHIAESMPAHVAMIEASLADTTRPDLRSRRFFKAFIDDESDPRRPTERFVDQIEELARMKKSPARRRRRDKFLNAVLTYVLKSETFPIAPDPDYIETTSEAAGERGLTDAAPPRESPARSAQEPDRVKRVRSRAESQPL